MRTLYKIERIRLARQMPFAKAIQQSIHRFSLYRFYSFFFHRLNVVHSGFGSIEMRQFTEKCLYDEPVSFL